MLAGLADPASNSPDPNHRAKKTQALKTNPGLTSKIKKKSIN